ncbi:MAG: rod shape-determining protein MreC [Armatimonadetes bacterium]|nr:rod shape-determining protein MreC [Armatimonadota bacterium]
MSGRRDTLFLVLFLAAGFGLGRLQTNARNAGKIDPFSNVVGRLIYPASHLIQSALDSAGSTVASIIEGPRLRRELAELRSLKAAWATYSERVDDLQTQIENLRALNGLGRRPGMGRVPADVIGYIAREGRITLSVGKDKGVEPGQAVISASGIVAVISVVGPTTSQATLITQPKMQIGAKLRKFPTSAGLVEGAGNVLRFQVNDTKLEIPPGEILVTSGLSEKIPEGLIIGRTFNPERIEEYGITRMSIFPAGNLGNLKEVLVLK